MQWKAIVAIFSLLIFFISSTGVVVFEHHCAKSGDFIGFYSDVDHDCGEKTVQSCNEEADSNCCKTQLDSHIPNASPDCCTTDVSLIQIDSDYSLSFSEFDFNNTYFELYAENNDLSYLQDRVVKINRGPPDLYLTQKRKRATFQVYLI